MNLNDMPAVKAMQSIRLTPTPTILDYFNIGKELKPIHTVLIGNGRGTTVQCETGKAIRGWKQWCQLRGFGPDQLRKYMLVFDRIDVLRDHGYVEYADPLGWVVKKPIGLENAAKLIKRVQGAEASDLSSQEETFVPRLRQEIEYGTTVNFEGVEQPTSTQLFPGFEQIPQRSEELESQLTLVTSRLARVVQEYNSLKGRHAELYKQYERLGHAHSNLAMGYRALEGRYQQLWDDHAKLSDELL